ncbi:MAG TPA: hypothetical protein VN901_16270 [Candidatus Acidoferrales bacterium]|nr:hypothetical protein [Candidatus Acidoferrales bacterium]
MKPFVEKRALTITTPLLAAYLNRPTKSWHRRVVNRLRAELTLDGPSPAMNHTVRLGFTNGSRKDINASA